MTGTMPTKDDSIMVRAAQLQANGTPYDKDKLNKRLIKARTALVLDNPFLGTLALNMPMEIAEWVPTAGTNGRRVYYNPWFLNELSDAQVVFLVAHEVMHPALEHMYRIQGRNGSLWNQAGDYVINQHLTDDGVGEFIDGGCLNKALFDAGDGITDRIYNILDNMPKDKSGGGGKYGVDTGSNGGIGDDLQEAEGSHAEKSQEAADWRVKVAQAAQAAKMMGKLTASQERFANEILNPKVDWRDVLRNFVEKAKSDQRSFERPNRRFIQQGMYLPSRSGDVLGEIMFWIDVSGSISSDELNQFAAEMVSVKEEGNPLKIHIGYFHSHTVDNAYVVVGQDEDMPNIGCGETGGTAFAPMFEFMRANDIDPVATIVLTDLYCSDYGTGPDCPLLWVSNHQHDAGSTYASPPFGEVVVM